MKVKILKSLKFLSRIAACGIFLQFAIWGTMSASASEVGAKPGAVETQQVPIKVTGKVTADDTSEGLPGVNVTVKGTLSGTISDANGNFSIDVPSTTSILVFSSIGYIAQEIIVGTQLVINVTMVADIELLEEVVVVGYGTMKKADLTGSVGSISTDAIVTKGTATLLESIQGEVPGVSITQNSSRAGGGFDIQIRGIQSIGNSAGPLYVVDGLVVSNIQMLNPADIERIDILKDASSTAIYGSRASEGVVMVTTKSGKGLGYKATKPVISYDGYVGMRRKTRMPDFQTGMEFMQYRFARYTQAANNPGDGSLNYINPNTRLVLLLNYDPILDVNGIQQVGPDYWDLYYPSGTGMSNIERLMADGEEYNWMDLVTQNAMQQNHYMSVSGSTDNSNYHFGIGYQQDEGIYLKDNENRINFKAAIQTQINKVVAAGMSLNLARTTDEWGSDTGADQAFYCNPYFIPRDEDGNLIFQPGSAVATGSTAGGQFSSMVNPLIDMENTINGAQKLNILGNVFLAFTPIKNLTLKSTLSPNIYQGKEFLYEEALTSSRQSKKTDRAAVEITNMFDWTWDNQLNYSLNVGDHSFDAMGLISMNKYTREEFDTYGEDFPANTTFYDLGSAAVVVSPASQYTEHSLLSYAGRLNYSYKSRYMVTATIRADGSSRFREDYRWGSFPSAAIAWRASEEDFLKNNWLDDLKFRLSYGMSGNNNVNDYATSTVASSSAYYAYGPSIAYGLGPNGIVNSAIQWEKTSEIDFGIDFSAFDNRVTIVTDVYNKVSDGLLMDRKLAIEAGGGATVVDNIGKVSNKGFELMINTVNVKTRDLMWKTAISFAKNKNSIEELYGGGVTEDLGNLWFVGQPVGVFYGYVYDGVVSDKPITVTLPKALTNAKLKDGTTFSGAAGDVVTFDHAYEYYYATYGWTEGTPIMKDLNNDGSITGDKDRKILGVAEPSWTGSFSTSLTYKNWDLSASVYAKQGFMVRSPFINRYMGYSDRGRMHLDWDYYIPGGVPILTSEGKVSVQPESHYSDMPYPTNAVTNGGTGAFYRDVYDLVDASYVKVKNITIGYTIPDKFLTRLGVSSLHLYANILNPFVFTKYVGFDPEWAGASRDQGGPSTVTYQFGINLKF